MRFLAWGLAFFLCACATQFAKPSVSLVGVDIESLGLFEQRFLIKLRVKNPNNLDIPVEGISFDVELNGRPFANGVSNVAVTIPRYGEAVLDIKASSSLASFLRQWRELEKAGRTGLDYRVKGHLQVSGYGALPFDYRDEITFPTLPPAGGGTPSPL